MLKSRIKIPDRILAILLSFLILCGVMPTNVLANEAVDYAGKFILRVLQKGTEDTFIEGAKVEYNIRVDGEVTYDSSSENIPVTDSQGRLIIEELSKFEYNAPLNNGRVVIYCTIQHDGYENVVDLIPVKQNTKEYRLYMKENPKRIVTVNKKVTGVESVDISNSVKINSEAINGTKPFAKGTTVNLEVNAPENAYISSLKVAGEVIKLDIYQQTFSKAMVITDDFAIDVDFYAGVKVLAAVTPNGKIELNERGNNYTINSDTTNNFIITKANQNIDFVITPNEGYVISHLKINGVEQAIEDNKIFKRRMAFSADSTIQAVFSKEYKVTITFEDDMGKVTPAPDCEGGTVGVVTGSVIDLKATPNVGYRVAWVKHEGNIIEEYTENDKSYERKFEILADQEIEICFQPNNYTVELVAEREYGQVGFWQGGSEEIIKVAYGNDVKLKYQPKANYAIIVNATDSNGQELKPIFNEDDNLESGWKSFTISNVTDNITINVTFTKIQMYPLSEIEISTEGLAREYKDGNVTRYIYKKDAIATISTDKDGIRLHKDEEDHIAGGLDIKSISIKSTDLDDPEKYEDHILKIGLIKVYDANNKTDKDSNWHTIEGKTPNTPYELEIMFDEQQSAPTIKFDREPNEHGYYNDDVTITVSADDFVSGLQSVKYEVLNCTEPQAGELYNYIEGKPVVESVTDLTFDVIAKKIDSGDAKLKVTVTDRAGNTNSKTIDLKINCVPPEVSINTSNEEDENEKKHPNYFNTSRTATVVFKDRADTFIQENAEKCIELLKKNADGEYVEIPKASMISWKHDGNVHTATIHFNDEGEYKWSFTGNYTNKAGLSNNGVTESSDSIYSFIIDKTAPDATIKLTASTEEPTVAPINSTEESSSITIWKKLVSTLTFGIWRNHAVEAEATATDNMSPMYQIEYYKSNSETALTADELTDAYDKNKFTTEKQIVKTDEIFAIYARVEDYAGNVTYVGTDGVIVDCVASKILITPEGATNNVFNSEFADKGVKVAIEVNDFDIKDTVSDDIYSGIKTIEYWIENENNVVTKSKETLYSFDYQRDNKVDSNGGTITITDCSTGTSKVTTHTGTVPTKDMLTHNWSGNITVNAKENNSDDVYVCVKVTDNAGNFDVEKQHMSINITNPTAEVQFTDEANRIVGDRGYFNHPRTATITITDRASAFDSENATDNIKISAYDVNGKEIEKDKNPFKISDWESNGDKHTATVTFNADANYEWSFSYKNKVGNNLDTTKIETGTSDTPFKFTVDTVAPEATIKSDNEIWNKILSVLTFGIWKNTPIIVEAEGVDLTSPLNTVEYYVDYSPKVLTVEDLDKLYKAGKFYIGTNTVDADAKFVVYARVEDYAGNVTYVGTDGMIYDSVESGIVITPENTPFKIDEKPVYNSTFKETGVKVDINVRDFDIDDTISDDIYSGIKNIEYWVECDGKKTDEGTLYSFDYVRDDQINSNGGKLTVTDWSTGKKVVTTKNTPTVPTSDMLLKEWKGSITVDAVANNSDNVVINVKVTDNAGNENEKQKEIAINIDNPRATIEFGDNTQHIYGGRGYFNQTRKATITLEDRASAFNAEEATKGIEIHAVDSSGNDITIDDSVVKIGEWRKVDNSYTTYDSRNVDTYTIDVEFKADANYDWSFDYTNDVGNRLEKVEANELETPFEFTVDTTAPTGTIKVDDNYAWDNILTVLTFGIWKNSTINVKAEANDLTSPLHEIEYYKSNTNEPLTRTELYTLYASEKFTTTPYSIKSDDKFAVYARIVDYAGNVTYIGTDGVIYDSVESGIAIIPQVTSFEIVDENAEKKPAYNSTVKDTGVKVDINVKDFNADDTISDDIYSGIKNIEYWIECDGKKTDEGTLYNFEYVRDDKINSNGGNLTITDCSTGKKVVTTKSDVVPTSDMLLKEWNGSITVDAKANNSDNVVIYVKVTDNAGNENEDQKKIAINIDNPRATIEFTDTPQHIDKEDRGYFNKPRKATITLEDRASAFNAEEAKNGIKISAKDSSNQDITISDSVVKIGEWKKVDNSQTLDGSRKVDTYTIDVDFKADANYTWSFDYTNELGNPLESIDTGYSLTPMKFTVDTTKPTGNVVIGTNVWDTLLSTLTFGLYRTDKAVVTANAFDKTSPVTVEYYKTDSTNKLQESELEKIKFQEYNKSFTVGTDDEGYSEQFVIYLRITDRAGNYRYVCSDGHIIDDVDCVIDIVEPNTKEDFVYGIDYKNGIKLDISVKDFDTTDSIDDNVYSGIKNISYWVECDGAKTQKGTLYDFDYVRDNVDKNSNGGKLTITDWSSGEKVVTTKTGSVPSKEDLCKTWDGSIVVDTVKNNSCNVVVYVQAIDNAGNVSEIKELPLDIDITAPEISVSYDNNKNTNGTKYFDKQRTATVVIKERTKHFDASKVEFDITAVDVSGEKVENAYEITKWETIKTTEATEPDEATHKAVIYYKKDANYTFDVSFTDKAGNTNGKINTTSVAPDKFTVDVTPPEGSITAKSVEGRSETWENKLIGKNLTFGFWSKKKISITGTKLDKTSPIQSVQYYKASSKGAKDYMTEYTVEQLERITDGWTDFDTVKGFELIPNEQCVIYVRIIDKAGNRTYISTNGFVLDDKAPQHELLAPQITINPQQPINGIYKKDVNVNVEVEEPVSGGTYSGLKTVSYKVFNRAVNPNVPTQSGILYQFDVDNPKYNQLKKSWDDTIVIDSVKNNSNDVVVEIYAEDNCKNISTKSISLKIDITKPKIDVSYSNNKSEGGRYFKEARIATIVITERNFNPEDVKFTMSKKATHSEWVESSSGTGNKDNKRWTSTINFSEDGDYTFGMSYIDLAGNVANSVIFAPETVASNAFTIDKTNPTIKVTYDNNNAVNTNYYNDVRKATIVINEHNFDSKDVKVTVTANDNGVAVTPPAVSGWISNGDNHTATINYNADALYNFDISYKDKAGNVAADYKADAFYVDKTAPVLSITGVKDKSAYKGDVIPVISYSDTNVDLNNISIELTGANRKTVTLDGVFTNFENGRRFTFRNFPKEKAYDDIYTLKASITDKAGNKTSQSMVFSVNRFGSTYSFGDVAENQNGAYITNSEDIVIKETNVNKLNSVTVTLYKNNDTLTLKQGEHYRLDSQGGDGSWYEYTYTIFKENFKDDGIYKLTLHSEDAAGNIAENNLETKDKQISFAVDTTKPNVSIRNLESKKTYAVESMTVEMSADDNIKLDTIIVELDGKEYKKWNVKDIEKILSNNGEFTFDISGGSTSAHNVRVICRDAAGNETIEEVEDFYVTTNLMIRYINNKPLFFGSIAGVLLVIAITIFLIVRKRKKED